MSHRKTAFKKVAAPQSGNLDVSTSGYGLLVTYLLRWNASIYRLVWIDILIWLVLYYALNFVYRFALNDVQKVIFENLVEQVGEWSAKIPVTFLLGFFVSNVVSRWWNIFTHIPTMTGPATTLVACVRGKEAARYRTEISRYMNLAWALAFWDLCSGLKQRFSTVKELMQEAEGELVLDADGCVSVSADSELDEFERLLRQCVLPEGGSVAQSLEKLAILNFDPVVRQHNGRLLTPAEFGVYLQRASSCNGKYSPEWHIPIYWALALTSSALKAGCIADTHVLLQVQADIQSWSANIRTLLNFAKRQLPLVYAQVVIVAVYTIYLSDIISRQLLNPTVALERAAKGYYIDYFVPVLAIVHVVFLLGWFKVALVLMDPFGTDEEDFPFSQTFSNNLKIAKVQCSSEASLYPHSLGGDVAFDPAAAAAAFGLAELSLEIDEAAS